MGVWVFRTYVPIECTVKTDRRVIKYFRIFANSVKRIGIIFFLKQMSLVSHD